MCVGDQVLAYRVEQHAGEPAMSSTAYYEQLSVAGGLEQYWVGVAFDYMLVNVLSCARLDGVVDCLLNSRARVLRPVDVIDHRHVTVEARDAPGNHRMQRGVSEPGLPGGQTPWSQRHG